MVMDAQQIQLHVTQAQVSSSAAGPKVVTYEADAKPVYDKVCLHAYVTVCTAKILLV